MQSYEFPYPEAEQQTVVSRVRRHRLPHSSN